MEKEPNKTKGKIPLMELVSKITGESIEGIYDWNKEDWLAFAKRLREIKMPDKKNI